MTIRLDGRLLPWAEIPTKCNIGRRVAHNRRFEEASSTGLDATL